MGRAVVTHVLHPEDTSGMQKKMSELPFMFVGILKDARVNLHTRLD